MNDPVRFLCHSHDRCLCLPLGFLISSLANSCNVHPRKMIAHVAIVAVLTISWTLAHVMGRPTKFALSYIPYSLFITRFLPLFLKAFTVLSNSPSIFFYRSLVVSAALIISKAVLRVGAFSQSSSFLTS